MVGRHNWLARLIHHNLLPDRLSRIFDPAPVLVKVVAKSLSGLLLGNVTLPVERVGGKIVGLTALPRLPLAVQRPGVRADRLGFERLGVEGGRHLGTQRPHHILLHRNLLDFTGSAVEDQKQLPIDRLLRLLFFLLFLLFCLLLRLLRLQRLHLLLLFHPGRLERFVAKQKRQHHQAHRQQHSHQRHHSHLHTPSCPVLQTVYVCPHEGYDFFIWGRYRGPLPRTLRGAGAPLHSSHVWALRPIPRVVLCGAGGPYLP